MLIRLALGPDGEILPDVRAKAPGRGAWIGVDRADAGSGAGEGQAAGRARPRVQDRRRSAFPTIWPSGSRPRCARRARPAGARGARRHAAHRLGADRGRRRARARCTCSSTPPMPARTASAGSIRRCGSANRRANASGLIPAERRHIVVGAWARECGTYRPDRPRRGRARDARARPVARLLSDLMLGLRAATAIGTPDDARL